MKKIYVIFLFLSACGDNDDLSYFRCDEMNDNISICYETEYIANNINLDNVKISVDLTNKQYEIINRQLNVGYPELNLSILIQNKELNIFYKDDIKGLRGETIENNIYLNYDDNCMEKYYVFSHELLHYISEYYLNVSHSDNAKHDVAYFFAIWADKNNVSWNNTIEIQTYLDIKKEICNGQIQ